MADLTVKRIDEMEAIYGGAFKRARAELGVDSFGMQVMDLPANLEQYPEHDHAETGQEEVFVVLRGGGEIEVDGDRHPINAVVMVRVGPGAKRKIWPGPDGIRVLVLGAKPGAVYEPPDGSQLGAPDSMALNG